MHPSTRTTKHEALNIITIQNQIRSPLLRLPAEIRNQIYGLVLDNGSINICRQKHDAPHLGAILLLHHHVHYPRAALHLLRVCQQTYDEARLLVFGLNQVIGDRACVRQFLGFCGTTKNKKISMEQASTIRAIDLEIGDNHFDPPWWSLHGGVGRDLGRLLEFHGLERVVIRINRRQRRHAVTNTAINESIVRFRKYVADAREQSGSRVEVEIIEQPYQHRS